MFVEGCSCGDGRPRPSKPSAARPHLERHHHPDGEDVLCYVDCGKYRQGAGANHGSSAAGGRASDDITLMAVSKTFPAERIREAYAAGLRVFGENRVQEFAGKGGRFA